MPVSVPVSKGPSLTDAFVNKSLLCALPVMTLASIRHHAEKKYLILDFRGLRAMLLCLLSRPVGGYSSLLTLRMALRPFYLEHRACVQVFADGVVRQFGFSLRRCGRSDEKLESVRHTYSTCEFL